EPIVTAPVWLATSNPETAWRLTQALHALEISLAALPAYLLARRVGLARWLAIGVAPLAVALPDAVYARSMLAHPLASPLPLRSPIRSYWGRSAPASTSARTRRAARNSRSSCLQRSPFWHGSNTRWCRSPSSSARSRPTGSGS